MNDRLLPDFGRKPRFFKIFPADGHQFRVDFNRVEDAACRQPRGDADAGIPCERADFHRCPGADQGAQHGQQLPLQPAAQHLRGEGFEVRFPFQLIERGHGQGGMCFAIGHYLSLILHSSTVQVIGAAEGLRRFVQPTSPHQKKTGAKLGNPSRNFAPCSRIYLLLTSGEVGLHGHFDDVGHLRNAKLLLDMLPMRVHRQFADAEFLTDFLGSVPLDDQPQDFLFPL